MRNGQLDNVLRHIRGLVAAGATKELLDRELLERFVAARDEAAFAAIVERHGPLVMGVCQRVLRDEHHAEDACQATFLVLARQAGAIRKRDSLGSWLHGVARRVAGKLRADVKRRAARDVTADEAPRSDPTGEVTWREGLVALDEEISRLPATYRPALILCHLEGRTHEEAARELGCSLGALRGRLERARECLRVRLVRRGVSLSAGLLGTVLVSAHISAALPPALAVGTVKAAASWQIARGQFRAWAPDHDDGEKTLLGHQGRWNGDDVVKILLDHPATARRLAWRLCDWLMGEQFVGAAALDALADGLVRHNLDVGWAVATVLRSRAFFTDANLNKRVLGPVEFLVGVARALERFDPPPSSLLLAEWSARLGQDLFEPPNVGGWPGGRAWLTTQAIIGRANYAAALVEGRVSGRPVPLDGVALARRHGRGRDLEDILTAVLRGRKSCDGDPRIAPRLWTLLRPGFILRPGDLAW
jgi:RNA polymerase sigma factor (sigma-70 family)